MAHSREQSTEVLHTEVASEVESTERVMKIKVRKWGTERTIDLCVTEEQFKSMTLLQLKKKIEPLFGLPVRDQVLVIDGEQLVGGRMVLCINNMLQEDDRLLSDYRIKDGSTIHLIKVPRSRGRGPGRRCGGMGDRQGRNQSMECVAIMLTGSDVSSGSAPHPQPAAVKDVHQD